MGSSSKRRWCNKTLTTCTIKGYHVLVIITLSLLTAFFIFQPSASDLSDILNMNAQYKAKLNETKVTVANIEHELHTSKTKQTNLQHKEKELKSSLDEKTQQLNDLKANNLKLKSFVKRLTRVKQQFQNETEIQRHRIKELKQLSQKTKPTNIDHENMNISIQTRTSKSTNKNEYWYMKNYNNWINGIGDSFMYNNETDSNCLFQSDSFLLHKEPLPVNDDTLFEGATYCQRYRFSHMFDRLITVHCDYKPGLDILFSGVKYYEHDGIFNGRPPARSDRKWAEFDFKNGEKNQFIIYLKNTTQTTWVYCNNAYDFHLSLLPLQSMDENLFLKKREKIEQNFGQNNVPPNVVLFIMTATSRSNFINAAKESVNYLNSLQHNYNHKSPSDILQFFRYSTVGKGSKTNLNALIAGKCDYCPVSDDNKCDGIATYYDRLGYYVWGLDEYRKNRRTPNDNEICNFLLADAVIPRGCKYGHGIQIETAAEYVKQGISAQVRGDKSVPHLMIFNVQSNRVQNGKAMYNLDRFIRSMIEVTYKDNTIINLIGDHGSAIMDNNLFSQWEYTNPVNIMLLPKSLMINLNNVQINQQRLVQPYDMHLFYKELLWKLDRKNELKKFSKANKKKNELYQSMIFGNLAKINDVALSKSILDEIIRSDRYCNGISDGFCFCDTMQSVPINDELIADNIGYVKRILRPINIVTGDGEWDCQQLRSTQFTMDAYVENKQKTVVKIAISKIISDEIERDHLLNEKRLLSFAATFSRENSESTYKLRNLTNIERIDDMKYQTCVTTDYDRQQFTDYNDFDFGKDNDLKLMFVDKEMSVKMLKSRPNKVDLEYCDCKDRDLTNIERISAKAFQQKKKVETIDSEKDKNINVNVAAVNKYEKRGNIPRVTEINSDVHDAGTVDNVDRLSRRKKKYKQESEQNEDGFVGVKYRNNTRQKRIRFNRENAGVNNEQKVIIDSEKDKNINVARTSQETRVNKYEKRGNIPRVTEINSDMDGTGDNVDELSRRKKKYNYKHETEQNENNTKQERIRFNKENVGDNTSENKATIDSEKDTNINVVEHETPVNKYERNNIPRVTEIKSNVHDTERTVDDVDRLSRRKKKYKQESEAEAEPEPEQNEDGFVGVKYANNTRQERIKFNKETVGVNHERKETNYTALAIRKEKRMRKRIARNHTKYAHGLSGLVVEENDGVTNIVNADPGR